MLNREGDVFGKGLLPDLLSSTWLVYFSELRLPLSNFTDLAWCSLSYPAPSTQYPRFSAFQGTYRPSPQLLIDSINSLFLLHYWFVYAIENKVNGFTVQWRLKLQGCIQREKNVCKIKCSIRVSISDHSGFWFVMVVIMQHFMGL